MMLNKNVGLKAGAVQSRPVGVVAPRVSRTSVVTAASDKVCVGV